MTTYRIDNLGFLRRDGKIVGWKPSDFFWSMRGFLSRFWMEKGK